MTSPVPVQAERWLEATIGSGASVERISPLPGSTSSALYVVYTRLRNTGSFRCVLRLFTNTAWLALEPDLAEHEARVLIEAQNAGLPAPRLIGFAPQDAGFGAPAVLMTFVDGEVQLRPDNFDRWLERLVETLVSIHERPAPSFRWSYKSWVKQEHRVVPVWSRHPERWATALDIASRPPPPASHVFIHRDFHPTNVLWRGQQVTGVVDWVNGCAGPASVDVAHCALNLALMYGAGAAARFQRLYAERSGGFVDDAYWDIDAILDWGVPAPRYYTPWEHFGLGPLDQATLCLRLEDHLARIVERAGSR